MTVEELITKLKTFPPHLPVLYQCCSDYEELKEGDVNVTTVTKRHGRYVGPYDTRLYGPDELPVTAEVCLFPGN